MRQIVLITDGCSNVGMDPVAAAAAAAAEHITVNVVGVVDRDEIDGRGVREIEEIARAGKGMSRIVPSQRLSQTVQMMTRKTVAHTIHQVVHHELKQILGSSDTRRSNATRQSDAYGDAAEGLETELPATLESLHPDQRAEVVRVIEDLSEKTPLKVVLLIDTSGSMRPKLAAVRETIRDLMLSLKAREGHSELAVFRFPGHGTDAVLELDWTDNLEKTNELFYKLNMKGTTPTGPAIMKVIDFILHGTKDDEEPYIQDESSIAR